MRRKIIVFGATGGCGTEICKLLDQLHFEHSAFVRKGSEQKISTKSTEILLGNVLEQSEVNKVFSEQTFSDVIIALGSQEFSAGNICFNGTKNIIDSLKSKDIVAKLHVISAYGAGDSRNKLKWKEKLVLLFFMSKAIKDHEMQEEIVKTNVGGYHIIRPLEIKDGPPSKRIFSTTTGNIPNRSISRVDVARFLVDSLIANKSGISAVCGVNY